MTLFPKQGGAETAQASIDEGHCQSVTFWTRTRWRTSENSRVVWGLAQ